MDCSTSGFPVLHYLLEFVKLMSIELVMLSSHLILCYTFSFCLPSFPASWSFPVSQFFASGGQSIGVSASVLPMNIQGGFPLGLTGLISLQSKGLSRVFSNTIVQKHQFFGTQLSLQPNSHMTAGETIALTRPNFVGKVTSLLFNMLSGLVIASSKEKASFNQTVQSPSGSSQFTYC